MSLLRTFNRLTVAIVKIIVMLLAALISLFVFVTIVSRNFFDYSFEYSVEGNQILFMWMCFLGIVVVNSMGTMLRFELLEQRVPPGLRRYWRSVLYLLELVVAVILAWAGWEMLEFADGQRFSTMNLSYFWLYLPAPVAGVLLFLKTLENLVDNWLGGEKPC